MKSEHRHELKTNELAQWIGNLPQWTRKNLKNIITISAVAIVVLGYYFWHNYQKNVVTVRENANITTRINQLPVSLMQVIQAQMQGADYSFALLEAASVLNTSAQTTSNDQLAALALIKQAQALRTELHYRQITPTKQQLTEQTNRAKDSYTLALKKASKSPSIKALAKLGIGLCEEELGNFDAAEKTYSEIANDDSLKGTAPAEAAGIRLATISDYKTAVAFKKSEKRMPEAVRPQISIDAPQPPADSETKKTDSNTSGQ